jgi:hypothetical protein
VIDWISFKDEIPVGDGQILIWCEDTDWVRIIVTGCCIVRDGEFRNDEYRYTHFSYITHPFAIPHSHQHPCVNLDGPSRTDGPIYPYQLTWLEQNIGPRVLDYAAFERATNRCFFAGQLTPPPREQKHLFKQKWALLFVSDEDAMLARMGMPT